MSSMLTRVRKSLVKRERSALVAIDEVRLSGGRDLSALKTAMWDTLAVAGLRVAEQLLDEADDQEFLDR